MPKKILIVDDSVELLAVLRAGFQKSGFTVRTADNGVDALKKTRSFAPDLILLDLIMPEMDGFAVCETLKKNRDTAQIPIVVLTGLCSELSRFAGLESGADEFLTKPFNFNEVVAKVNEVLERKAAATAPVTDYAPPDATRKASRTMVEKNPATTLRPSQKLSFHQTEVGCAS